jgi:hypothetical protein
MKPYKLRIHSVRKVELTHRSGNAWESFGFFKSRRKAMSEAIRFERVTAAARRECVSGWGVGNV